MRWIDIGSHAVAIIDRCDEVRCSRCSGAACPFPKGKVIRGIHVRTAHIEIEQDVTVTIYSYRSVEGRCSGRSPRCWQEAIEVAGVQDCRNRASRIEAAHIELRPLDRWGCVRT